MELIAKKKKNVSILMGIYTCIGLFMVISILIRNEYTEYKVVFYVGIFLLIACGLIFILSIVQPKKVIFYNKASNTIVIRKFKREYIVNISEIKKVDTYTYHLAIIYIYIKDNKRIMIGEIARINKVEDRLNSIIKEYSRNLFK